VEANIYIFLIRYSKNIVSRSRIISTKLRPLPYYIKSKNVEKEKASVRVEKILYDLKSFKCEKETRNGFTLCHFLKSFHVEQSKL
jgi:hypothetical protein